MASYDYIIDRGVIVPDTASTRADVEAEFKTIFGNDLITDASSPAGRLITRIAETRDALARNNAEIANQINPDIAGGIFLDAIWALSGGGRNPSQRSTVNGVILGGVPGTVVPAGSVAVTVGGIRFELTANITLSPSGSATGQFVALQPGPISVSAGSLNRVISSVLGWETVTNPNPATPGRDRENDAHARRRRRQTLAQQTTSYGEAIISRLMSTPGVRSVNFLENFTGSPKTIDTVPLVEHSIWACVEGGSDTDIAQVLFDTKTAGANYNGSQSVIVTDQSNGQPYTVLFDRPSVADMEFKITVSKTDIDVQRLIPEYVMQYANGELPGDVSFVVGADVSPWEIAGAINQLDPRINVRKVELRWVLGGGNWSTDVFHIYPNVLARTNESAITVIEQ